MLPQADAAAVVDVHAFRLQKLALASCTFGIGNGDARACLAVFAQHTEPGDDDVVRADAQRACYRAMATGLASQQRNLPIGDDASARNAGDGLVHGGREAIDSRRGWRCFFLSRYHDLSLDQDSLVAVALHRLRRHFNTPTI